MSIPMHRLGGRGTSIWLAFAHDDDDIEQEYDRLRDLARAEAEKRNDCFARSRQAYEDGDGAGAKELSNQGKAHAARMDDYNQQASDFIFRENNASGRVEADSIDLHGLYVEEAERILEERIRADQRNGQTHLYAIVGKGHHSAGGVQKLKPKVEELCQELGLRAEILSLPRTLVVTVVTMVVSSITSLSITSLSITSLSITSLSKHHQPQHHQPQHHQQGQQNDDDGQVLPWILKKLEKACCVVM
ncbi:nuclear WD PRL1 [Fusarium subglutinans]|uniref:Nuclear WD PRL1 n=1 Tax=Gibberella subglutinans TaxID=42677 RepID=A0A8H5Q475_GIBSU|nr:nuclear WD PRL1 [Fusarium subglutinans]KAF5607732.1 nuclear WD PRL1 [Fusarium subglutinans]